jgi:hypothetical protein
VTKIIEIPSNKDFFLFSKQVNIGIQMQEFLADFRSEGTFQRKCTEKNIQKNLFKKTSSFSKNFLLLSIVAFFRCTFSEIFPHI